MSNKNGPIAAPSSALENLNAELENLLSRPDMPEHEAEFKALFEIPADIQALRSGKIDRPDDPDGDIGIKARRVLRENFEAIRRGASPHPIFLNWVADGFLCVLNEWDELQAGKKKKKTTIESVLRVYGKGRRPVEHERAQSGKPLTPDREIALCFAYRTGIEQRAEDESIDAADKRGLDAAYKVQYGRTPQEDEAGVPATGGLPPSPGLSSKVVDDRKRKVIRPILQKHGVSLR
jgi:hypothetical protein